MYYATKNNITKQIKKQDLEIYKKLGWTITQSGEEKYDPYDYEITNKNGNCLQPIVINGESFLGYSSFYCINTKTYVEEPSRVSDGSIPNINDYDTFIVPRVKVSFDYMTIEDFRRFLRAITPNEFVVSYYDYEADEIVSYKMYIEPREMAKIYNRGYSVLAVTGIEVSLIATLNDMDYAVVTYYDEETKLNEKNMVKGLHYSIENGSQYVKEGYNFSGWNTKKDGTGTTYNSYDTIKAKDSMNLYAQWVVA